jgi:hypothetical protein
MSSPLYGSQRLLFRTVHPTSRFVCEHAAARQRVVSYHRRCRYSRLSPTKSFQTPQSNNASGVSCARSQRRGYKTVQELRSRYKFGPFSVFSGVSFLVAGVGMTLYFRYEKERLQRQRIAEASKGVGKPRVGGSFELVDHNGRVWSSEEMKGKFSLVRNDGLRCSSQEGVC